MQSLCYPTDVSTFAGQSRCVRVRMWGRDCHFPRDPTWVDARCMHDAEGTHALDIGGHFASRRLFFPTRKSMVSVGSLGTVAAGSAPTSARASSSQSMAHAQPMAASPPPASVHPLSSAASMPPPPSQALWSTRLVDLLNLVRHEFDVIGNDAMHFKSQRVELEHRISQQINEVAPVSYTHLTLPTNREV